MRTAIGLRIQHHPLTGAPSTADIPIVHVSRLHHHELSPGVLASSLQMLVPRATPFEGQSYGAVKTAREQVGTASSEPGCSVSHDTHHIDAELFKAQ